MIKIQGYTIKQLSKFYNIPTSTIYHWHQNDPENTIKRIINRKIADSKKIKIERIAKIKKEVEQANKVHQEEEFKFDIVVIGTFIFIFILICSIMVALWNIK